MASSEKNLWEKSATEVVSLLRSKEISPDEALDENLKRIKETHSSINAVVTICEERARHQINNLDTERKDQPGYLYGLPIVIKDLTDVKKNLYVFGASSGPGLVLDRLGILNTSGDLISI